MITPAILDGEIAYAVRQGLGGRTVVTHQVNPARTEDCGHSVKPACNVIPATRVGFETYSSSSSVPVSWDCEASVGWFELSGEEAIEDVHETPLELGGGSMTSLWSSSRSLRREAW